MDAAWKEMQAWTEFRDPAPAALIKPDIIVPVRQPFGPV
jgi:hypothetical protein